MSVLLYSNVGRYYLGVAEQQFRIVLQTPYGIVSELWEEGSEPEFHEDETPPSEALEMIQKRLNEYWLKTDRDKSQKTIDILKENIEAIDKDWAEGKIKKFEKLAHSFKTFIEDTYGVEG